MMLMNMNDVFGVNNDDDYYYYLNDIVNRKSDYLNENQDNRVV